jgi:hypothetical protein
MSSGSDTDDSVSVKRKKHRKRSTVTSDDEKDDDDDDSGIIMCSRCIFRFGTHVFMFVSITDDSTRQRRRKREAARVCSVCGWLLWFHGLTCVVPRADPTRCAWKCRASSPCPTTWRVVGCVFGQTVF